MVLLPKDPLMNLSPFRCLNFLKSWQTTHGWEMCLSLESLIFSQREEKQQGKIAPKSSGARHRRIWYETDTKAEKKKKIWVYSSSPKSRSSKCWQVAHLQASNISVLIEYSEKAHQVLHNAQELCCFYKHAHTQRTPSPCNRCLCLTQMCSLTCLTWPLPQLMNVLPQAFAGMVVGQLLQTMISTQRKTKQNLVALPKLLHLPFCTSCKFPLLLPIGNGFVPLMPERC